MAEKNTAYCFICKKRYARSEGRHFFTFPWKNDTLIDAWLSNLGLKDKPASMQPTLRSCICDMHFSPLDTKKSSRGVLLKKGAVPLPSSPIETRALPSTSQAREELVQPERTGLIEQDVSDCAEVVFPLPLSPSMTQAFPSTSQSHEEFEQFERTEQTVHNVTVCAEAGVSLPLSPTRALPSTSQAYEEIAPPERTGLIQHEAFDYGEQYSSDSSELLDMPDFPSEGYTANTIEEAPPATRHDTSTKDGSRKRMRLSPNFCVPRPEDTPRKLRRKVTYLYSAFQKTFLKKKMAQQNVRRLKKRVENLKELLQQVYEQDLISGQTSDLFTNSLSDVAKKLLQRNAKRK